MRDSNAIFQLIRISSVSQSDAEVDLEMLTAIPKAFEENTQWSSFVRAFRTNWLP